MAIPSNGKWGHGRCPRGGGWLELHVSAWREGLAREGDGGKVRSFIEEGIACTKLKNTPSRSNLDFGGLRNRWRVSNTGYMDLQVLENWELNTNLCRMPIVCFGSECGWMSSTILLWSLIFWGLQLSPPPGILLSRGPPGTCTPSRSHSEFLVPKEFDAPKAPSLLSRPAWVPHLGLPPRESWCVQPSLGVDEGLFIKDRGGDGMWELEWSYVCARPLEMLTWARVGVCDGAGSLCHQGLEWNFDECKNFKIKPGLPGHYKGIFIKRGGITYFI